MSAGAMVASTGFTVGFVALVLALAAGLVAAVHHAGRTADRQQRARWTRLAGAGVVAWLAVTLTPAAAGWLSFTTPPSMPLLILASFALTLALALSSVGGRLASDLPLGMLVGFQGFRIPVELLLHRGYVEGFVPVQMTYAGLNYDVVSGLTAIVVGLLAVYRRIPAWGVAAWNVLGLALLATIVTIAILSAPVPFRAFHNEPANVWVLGAPWVWLPTVLVQAALLGHLLVFRRLAAGTS